MLLKTIDSKHIRNRLYRAIYVISACGSGFGDHNHYSTMHIFCTFVIN